MSLSETTLHPQTRRHLINTDRMRKAAIQEFAREGFAGAKVSSIVAGAALSQPSFYRVWPSKEAAYNDIVHDTDLRWQGAAFNSLLLEETRLSRDTFEQKVDHFFQVLTADLSLTRLMLQHHRVADQHGLYVDIYQERFQVLQEVNVIRTELNPELLAQVYCALVERLLHARLLEQPGSPIQAANDLVSVFYPLLSGE